jgi:hypothetical protein
LAHLAPVLGLSLWAGTAAADPAKAACVRGAEDGQRLRAQGKLWEARESFTACASERCPALVRSDCSGWLAEVETAVPSIVVRATAAEDQAHELYDVEVRVDGVVLTTRLDGRDLPVNPGEHHLSFAAAERVPAEETVVIRMGEKHRLLTVILPSTHPAPPPALVVVPPAPVARSRVSPLAKGLLIGGGVAVIGGAALGASGWSAERSLRDRCAPGCTPAEVDRVRLRLRVADVALAAGVAALAGAGILVWTRPEGTAVGVSPVAGGAMVALRFGSRE